MTSDQKVAIVTGGSYGIGRATAVALARDDRAKVVVAAHCEKAGEETTQIVKVAVCDGIFVKTDVANEDDVKALLDKTIKAYGRLDYAVNNAGFDEAETTLVEETSSDFDKIMNINVRGVWLCMKYEI